jgi:hypothetical protein
MEMDERKKKLAQLLAGFAKEQESASVENHPVKPKRHSNEDRAAWYRELAREQTTRETWEERQHYYFPPVIPEDIAHSILQATNLGTLDLANDPVAATLMDPEQIREMIRYERLDASDLPLLKYRIDRLLGLTTEADPPDRRAMLSSLAYAFRGDNTSLDKIHQEVSLELTHDLEHGQITQTELDVYSRELNQIIDQYR